MITQNQLIRLYRSREQLAALDQPQPSLSSVAQAACLSQSHFIRRFSALFGETPHQLRTRMRLEKAKQLLVLGEGSVTDVCTAVGFSSLGSFSWLFSKRFGESPQSYRCRLYPSVEIPGRLPAQMIPGCISLMVSAWASPQFSRSAPGANPLG